MKEQNTRYIANLISRKILGIISSQEEEILSLWLSESDENRQIYQGLTSGTTLRERFEIEQRVDIEEVKESIHKKIAVERSGGNRKKVLSWGVAIAALITMGLIFTFNFFDGSTELDQTPEIALQSIDPSEAESIELILEDGTKIVIDEKGKWAGAEGGLDFVENVDKTLVYNGESKTAKAEPVYNTLNIPRGKHYNIKLSDGSTIHLNAGSQMRYPVNFVGSEREVWLAGEAYFEVTTSSKPFKVHSGELTVRVLGTSFNLMAYDDEPIFETTLIDGSVQVEIEGEERDKQQVTLTPGRQAKFDIASGSVDVVRVNTAKYTAWKDNLLIFDYETIEQISRKLSRWYDVEIEVDSEELGRTAFFGKLPKHSDVTEILDLMKQIHPFEYEIEDGNIILK